MIAVLSDDFSGAAELACIGAAHGLRAEVWIGWEDSQNPAVDLVAIDCGTRALGSHAAGERVTAITAAVLAHHPSLLFKKTDSVLRGYVAVECAAMARACGKEGVLLAPANPSRQRRVVAGHYLVAGQPLDETPFAEDPEFPAQSASVSALLDNRTGVPIEIPDVSHKNELTAMAAGLNHRTLPAGAADFFAALLRHFGHQRPEATDPPQVPSKADSTLWICGSQAAWSAGLAARCARHGLPLSIAPTQPDSLPAILAIGEGDGSPPPALLEQLVTAACRTVDRLNPAVLALEGGGTAAALCQRAGWNRFAASAGDRSGVGILAPLPARTPTLLVKPGSYPWPAWALLHHSLCP